MLGTEDRIGILGGTFNPIHNGHLILAQTAFEACELSKIIFVPSSKPPHKSAANLIPAQHRVSMIECAIEGDPRFEVSDVEIRREGTSYSIDTVMQIKRTMPAADLYFIIGADTLPELHLWRSVYKLLELCTFVTFTRPGFDRASLAPADLKLAPPWPEKLMKNIVAGRLIDISSSDIRHRIAEGFSIRYLVPQLVETYIAEHHLYGR